VVVGNVETFLDLISHARAMLEVGSPYTDVPYSDKDDMHRTEERIALFALPSVAAFTSPPCRKSSNTTLLPFVLRMRTWTMRTRT
jgi:hypothetical protein